VVANAGDSRAVICRAGGMAEALSFDHKPFHVSVFALVELIIMLCSPSVITNYYVCVSLAICLPINNCQHASIIRIGKWIASQMLVDSLTNLDA
jgi:hypothetical protein